MRASLAASRSGAGVNPAAAGARFGAAGPCYGQTAACRLSVQASSSLGEGSPAADSTPSLRSSGLDVPPPRLEDLATLQNLPQPQPPQPAQQLQDQANNIVSGCLGACLSRTEGLPAAAASSSSSSEASSEARAWSAAAELASVTPSCFRTAAAAARSEPGQLDGMHKPVGLVVGSAWLMTATVQLAGAAALSPVWLPLLAGGMLGGLYSAANHIGVRRLWRSPTGPLRVVVTGGSTGIGKALAREFLRSGDQVIVTSRSLAGAQRAVEQLREEVGPGIDITGLDCDVSCPASVDRLVARAQAHLGAIDVVVNNAGYSGSFQSLLEQSAEQVERVVRTNLLGSLLVTRAALRAMAEQPGGGHIFNLEGAGADGSPTPKYAAYGATKIGIAQLQRTMQVEAAGLPNPVGVHNLSPGMVLTELLLEGATPANKQAFNILCEHPETVAAFLVPRARSVVARGQAGAAIRYLTPARAMAKLLTAPLNIGKYFDSEGRAVYPAERERILGQKARRTQRLQRRAARRSVPLQLAYSFSMALGFFVIVSDALAHGPAAGPGL